MHMSTCAYIAYLLLYTSVCMTRLHTHTYYCMFCTYTSACFTHAVNGALLLHKVLLSSTITPR